MDDVPLDARLAERGRPPGRAVMHQTWRDLLFLHWRVEPSVIQRTLPQGLTVDTFDGSAWVGVVPFYMRSVRPWWSPSVPGISNFLELNLRTYAVGPDGRPGVWFYSLDANQWLAVKVARALYRLPYFHAEMEATSRRERRDLPDGFVDYRSRRRGTSGDQACRYRYRGVRAEREAEPGTLEFYLVERYLLFAARGGRLYSGRVWHTPYPVRDAEVAAGDDTLFALNRLARPSRPADHAVYSRGVEVEVFPLRAVSPRP